jgi:hypothetical protein
MINPNKILIGQISIPIIKPQKHTTIKNIGHFGIKTPAFWLSAIESKFGYS